MAWYLHVARGALIAILAFGPLLTGASAAATSESKPPPAAAAAVAAKPQSPVDEDAPVQVAEPSEKALTHFRTGLGWWFVGVVYDGALLLAILFSGFSARLRDVAFRIGRKWFFALCVYLVLLSVIAYVAGWPLDFYQEFIRAHAYGLSNQTFGKWFGDSLIELAVGVIMGALILWAPYLLLRKSPRRAWLYAGLAMVPFFLFVQLVEPVAIEPLFNQFTPLKDKALETKILAQAERAGIHGSRIYEVNKSVDTRTVNAYVTGFAGTKRIVLWDNAIQKLSEHELLFVMGHEMGHYVLNHVLKGLLVLCALTLLAFYIVQRAGTFVVQRFGKRFGFDRLDDFASLPLLALLVGVVSFVLGPVGLAYSRHVEHEADRFGLEITRFNHSAATGFVRLQEENLSVPRPGRLYSILFGSHPTIGDRIDFFNTYKPWKQGEPLKYGSYFEAAPTAGTNGVAEKPIQPAP